MSTISLLVRISNLTVASNHAEQRLFNLEVKCLKDATLIRKIVNVWLV